MQDRPKVSILIITYNHERFIELAVRSALVQEAEFAFEIVVGEDCSTDGTRNVLHRLDAEFPGRLRLLFRDRNLGAMENARQTYAACRGEYLAFLEGDDYWTDPSKLRKQVAVLDADPGCALCFHPTRYVDTAGVPTGYVHPPETSPRRPTVEDLFQGNLIQTCSAVLRRSVVPELPGWLLTLGLGDWPLFILAADAGTVVRLDGVMADYRVHPGGMWTAKPAVQKHRAVIEMLDALGRHFAPRYAREVARLLACYHCELARELDRTSERDGDAPAVAEHLGRALAAGIRATPPGTTVADGLTEAAAAVVGRFRGAEWERDVTRLRAELTAALTELDETRAALDAVRGSKTWRLAMVVNRAVTGPLAWLARRLRSILQRSGSRPQSAHEATGFRLPEAVAKRKGAPDR